MDLIQAIQDAILEGKDKQLSSLLQTCTVEAVSTPIDEEGTTLLHLAANTDNPHVLSNLLDLGVAVNVQNGDGFTPLHVAAMWGKDECVRQLMDRGADPDISDYDEMTPLDYAKSEGHSLCVLLLNNSSCKENSAFAANTTPHFPSEKHLSPTNISYDPTIDQSMAEAFVSLYLNMTQVASADLTEVTQISDLAESSSLLDILTNKHTSTHPTTSHHNITPSQSSHITTAPPHHHNINTTSHNGDSSTTHYQEHKTIERGTCVRWLELANIAPTNTTPIREQSIGLVDSVSSPEEASEGTPTHEVCEQHITQSVVHSSESSILALELQAGEDDSSSSKLASSSHDDDLFTTALQEPSFLTTSHTPSPSTTPFLAESLRKIELRRQALRANQTTPHSPLNTIHNTSYTTISAQKTPEKRTKQFPEKTTSKFTSHKQKQRPKLTEQLILTSSHHNTQHMTSTNASNSNLLKSFKSEEKSSNDTTIIKKHNAPTTHHNTSLVADTTFVAGIDTQIPAHFHQLTNQQLRQSLIDRGEQPGPVTDHTRSAYLLYLTKLEAGIQPAGNTGYKGYKYELALVLNGTSPIPDFTSLEYQIFKQYRTSRLPNSPLRTLPSITASAFPLPRSFIRSPNKSPRSKRDWSTKTHFNYLLLDPSHLNRLHHTSENNKPDVEQFRVFIEAVFYVGKGKNARSLQHLKDARDKMNSPKTKLSTKLSRILSIWQSGHGVVSLHLFYNTTAEEAFSREACMIDAIGLDILTNVQKGHVYGEIAGWTVGKRRQFGVFLLHKAYHSYLLDPPQPVGQDDL